ncbi:bifunctional phosphopantothenoylcysteine decarboxylase/phosphopantothenate--cysteine ligase CoaBC [Salinicoccus roseus]|jgi:phosphopantothenoylcysteine decarboxylase/phosphopantothenate--cysteine ligase|uniref:bifunctional phosphopantothenoylcysteine decarboxylase/phosphopantothenate--cysteine ligase CoaBC n=1 Tax=Salinicoccus roseus TaxID=45670 RepID=UPI000F4E7566|nr:bifunctional phosphopantothenoylcysteine decarboxylase/phosphopantothenate--cysteine ligase CoaBC [Salinicoccus roseus]RPE54494.1 phosphopantothenate-cysteine ligase /phosphopantothenoylcysteine decarboxylase [Salinicoccus roseus]GGA65104.1 phosphopantothenoylcysteine decarboxylase [Salinicoccus roseus]
MANIVIGVTGGIAAYKAVDLTSKLIQAGHEVRVVLTDNALEFITPLAFQAIGRNHVYTNTFKEEDPSVISHINIGEWADIIVVAPITANTISKLACGIYDNMLLNVLAANTKPVILAPAMNVHMYNQPAIRRNMQTLMDDGYHFIDSESGFLACGYNAKGRMANVPDIKQYIEELLMKGGSLKGKKVLVTAGPTQESIDPIRYITNHSSGRMGYAIAEAAQKRGAEVVLVSGPVNLAQPAGVHVIDTVSTEEMFTAVKSHMDADLGIFTAAVSDFTPITRMEGKMKKQKDQETVSIDLKKTPDILKYAGDHSTGMYIVGFAAETENVEQYAQDKLERKNADCIVMNDVSDTSIGMNSPDNEVVMLFREGAPVPFEKMDKRALGEQIIDALIQRWLG